MLDEPLVDHAFERFFAEAIDARGRQRLAANVLAVDDRHHVVLGPLRPRQRIRIRPRTPAACGLASACACADQKSAHPPWASPCNCESQSPPRAPPPRKRSRPAAASAALRWHGAIECRREFHALTWRFLHKPCGFNCGRCSRFGSAIQTRLPRTNSPPAITGSQRIATPASTGKRSRTSVLARQLRVNDVQAPAP